MRPSTTSSSSKVESCDISMISDVISPPDPYDFNDDDLLEIDLDGVGLVCSTGGSDNILTTI